MNSFKVTYTDGTHYTTNANGTLAEFTAYLMQFGGVVTDENPVTGKEARRYIQSVKQAPNVGEVYAFKYEDQICPLVVTEVNDTHVYYKFPDSNGGEMEYCPSYPMTKEVWEENKDGRVFVGNTKDEEALSLRL